MKSPLSAVAAAALLVVSVASASLQAEVTELDIGVRSTAEGWPKIKKAEAEAKAEASRTQTYAILSVSQADAESNAKLVKPVDAMAVAKELEHQLGLQGFVKRKPNTKPEILITGEYGRGFLPNPYQTASRNPGNNDIGSAGNGIGQGIATVDITGADLGQLMSQRQPGYEQKLQKASYEKLYIRVRGWKYPTDSKHKPEVLWTTIMVVDDPDNRDLNTAFKDMLASGAPYFGRAVDKPEIDVYKPLPVGRVEVGTATVVADKNKK